MNKRTKIDDVREKLENSEIESALKLFLNISKDDSEFYASATSLNISYKEYLKDKISGVNTDGELQKIVHNFSLLISEFEKTIPEEPFYIKLLKNQITKENIQLVWDAIPESTKMIVFENYIQKIVNLGVIKTEVVAEIFDISIQEIEKLSQGQKKIN